MLKSLLALLFLAGCAHTPKPFEQVRLGMSLNQVRHILGAPSDENFTGDVVDLTFHDYDPFTGAGRTKIVSFRGGKVIAVNNDIVAEQREFEIERAKAASTKITIANSAGGYPGGYGSVWNSSGLSCPHSNAFGKYPPGGGCNAFGCWPAGGECTAFGCSGYGNCGAVHCENRIASLPCH